MNPFWSKRRLPDTYFSFGEQRTLDERIVSRS
jgi:hypothetical protein